MALIPGCYGCGFEQVLLAHLCSHLSSGHQGLLSGGWLSMMEHEQVSKSACHGASPVQADCGRRPEMPVESYKHWGVSLGLCEEESREVTMPRPPWVTWNYWS